MPKLKSFDEFQWDGTTIVLEVYSPKNFSDGTFELGGVTKSRPAKRVTAEFSVIGSEIKTENEVTKVTEVELERVEIN